MTLDAARGVATQKQVAIVSGSTRQKFLALIASEEHKADEKAGGEKPTEENQEPKEKSAAIEKTIAEDEKIQTMMQIRENLERDIGIRKRKLNAAHCWAAYAACK